jgi:hypothetical protein
MKPLKLGAISSQLAEIHVNCPFRVLNVLENSLDYPADGIDGDPVKYLGGSVHSFIFVDYSKPKEESTGEVATPAQEGIHDINPFERVTSASALWAYWKYQPQSNYRLAE